MLSILLACLAMACRDALATFLTVAEARGRATLAGTLDALGDLAGIACTVFGAGVVIKHGLDTHSLEVIGSMVLVSFFGTAAWTRLAQRIGQTPKPAPIPATHMLAGAHDDRRVT